MPRTEVSSAQVEAYRRDGYLVIEDFLSADELERWRDAVDGAVAARNRVADQERRERLRAKGLLRREGDNDDDDEKPSYYETVFTQRLQLWTDSPAVREIMLDPEIGRLAATLAGVDGIRIWHDQASWGSKGQRVFWGGHHVLAGRPDGCDGQALIKEPWASPTGGWLFLRWSTCVRGLL
jgi:hypothetical protein